MELGNSNRVRIWRERTNVLINENLKYNAEDGVRQISKYNAEDGVRQIQREQCEREQCEFVCTTKWKSNRTMKWKSNCRSSHARQHNISYDFSKSISVYTVVVSISCL